MRFLFGKVDYMRFLFGEQIGLKSVVAAVASAAVFLWGKWDGLMTILLVLIGIDYLTGVIASIVHKDLSSKVGYIGISRKVLILMMVSVSHQMDLLLGGSELIRNGAIFFYCANELLSITENVGRVGLPVPEVLKQAIQTLKSKEGDK